MKFIWSKPHHGIQHCTPFKERLNQTWWCTVVERGSFAELTKWTPGCKFNPREETFRNAEEARLAGEKWLSDVGQFEESEAG